MVGRDREGGVSEVVGTILMVAMVVILAAIAGSMVFGMELLPEEPKTAVVTATRSGDVITFVNHGGMNMDRASEIRCWIGGVGGANDNFTLDARAGATETYTSKEAVRVVVVGRFVDNESWIVLDKAL